MVMKIDGVGDVGGEGKRGVGEVHVAWLGYVVERIKGLHHGERQSGQIKLRGIDRKI